MIGDLQEQHEGRQEKQQEEPQTWTTITIEKLINGGNGLGRLDNGEIVFVPGAAPGDQVAVTLAPGPGKTRQGKIQRIVVPSADRIDVVSSCPVCDWQHLTLPAQRTWKKRILAETLSRVGKLDNPPVADTLFSEPDASAFHYRNKVQLTVENHENGVKIGYQQRDAETGRQGVTPLSACVSMPPVFEEMAGWLQVHLPPTAGASKITLRMAPEQQVLVSFIGKDIRWESLPPVVEALVSAYPRITGVDGLEPVQGRHRVFQGQGFLVFPLAEKHFQVSADSFFQVNLPVAEAMIRQIAAWLPEKTDILVDAYAGVGTFAMALQDRAERILAVENSPSAVADAQENRDLNGCPHVEILLGDTADVLAALEDTIDTLDTLVDILILDPPRAGCDKTVLSWVNTHVRDTVIYMSCDPATLARDLRQLVDGGWTVETVIPVDMFPQTHHIEALVKLVRNKTL